MAKVSATVRAEVLIEVYVGTWEGGSTFEQLDEVGAREAIQTINNKLRDSGVRIIGEPKIKVSTFSKD